ncbi:MAG: DUF1329 domain-containing protein [Desulfatitalea sp.]|nr:DUF1329 domain-containing protein [Desulfatitalea sp.]NNJ98781.1 DUF1329 domain-containing protein [Desulfatitalea sp.]
MPTVKDLQNNKKFYDDPRPLYSTGALGFKNLLPQQVYEKLSYDVGAMKKLWAETIGFKSPDAVNKIAPEIKPGTYSYKDKEQFPGLKALMTEYHYNRFKPGAPPFAGNFPEIKIVPTQQYYYALPIAEATKASKTQLDDKSGIIKEETYVAGYPFPRPEGKFKAYQVFYNWHKRSFGWDSKFFVSESRGWTKSLKEDNVLLNIGWFLRLKGRTMEPYGWFDERAQMQNEERGVSTEWSSPRDMFGNVYSGLIYLDSEKYDQNMFYVSGLRRVRLMSSTDVQDSVGGADLISLDIDGCSQKLSNTIFPSKLEMIAERELLLPNNKDGSAYFTPPEKGLEIHNLEWERRPVYVVKMTINDKNFIYSHRILYFDTETFILRLVENYDQKGRLYRTYEYFMIFAPDMGMPLMGSTLAQDHLDLHSTSAIGYCMPAPGMGREKISLEYLFKSGK